MKLYQKLKIENSNNAENIANIEEVADRAIDYAIQYVEDAVSNSYLTDEGFLRLTFVEGQQVTTDLDEVQKNFDEKFSELINLEYSELK